ncbi:MAG: hypothetical protein ABSA45_08705 [Verrucomicrobiota bacterium]
MKTLRIFISSPGDVRPERVRALGVAQKLQTKYRAFINLEPILWEHEAMSACSTFQAQIVPPSKADIVICILWSRIGMRLPADYKRPDGSVPTGTEWEFEDAYAAHQAKGTPDLYVYRKTAEARIELGSDSDREYFEWKEQKKALDGFLDRWFKGHDGSFKAAFNTFENDEQFEKMLTEHLDRIIGGKVRSDQDVAEDRQKITWFEGSPFLGLRAFQPEHAPIFFGRDLDTRKILNRLEVQAGSSGRVFLMILGMSGCGKSSVARAGVLPALQSPGETRWDCWRHLILRPSEAANSLLSGLGEALLKSLPELAQSGYNAERLAVLLRNAPIHAIPLLEAALNQAAKTHAQEKGPSASTGARLFLLIDQFEEVFTLERFRGEKDAFVGALAALSRSGLAWVVVTMRSDLYGHCTEISTLMELKGDDGQYDLTPPGVAELPQMIRLPALAAGLRYEIDPKTGRKLDDALLEEAWKNPESLPLLEFTLDELFKGKSAANVLTWEAYRALGGMQGAIARRAETEYQELSKEGQAALPWVFGRLVTFEHNHATAQQARAAEFASRPGADEVVRRFIAANLFVTAGGHTGGPADENTVIISMAHEALLEGWPLLKDWIESHRENLKSHAAVTADTKRWLENNRDPDYLYRSGQPLNQAKAVLDADFLSKAEEEFVRASLRNVAKQQFQDSLATGERMAEISAQLRAGYPELRRQILRAALASGIDETREHAAMLLGTEPVEELTRELVRLILNDPTDAVRRAAATSLIQLDHGLCFDDLAEQCGDAAGPAAIRALAHVRVAADTVPTPTGFEQRFRALKPGHRSKVVSQSRVLRLSRGWPTLFLVLIPTVALSSIFAAIFKSFPGVFNYALCQTAAGAAKAVFDAVIACVFWGGIITFFITLHRVVFRSAQGKKSFWQPWTALVAGAIGGMISSALLLAIMVFVCDAQTTEILGWTEATRLSHWSLPFWNDILWRTRDFWPYLFMGTGLGVGMAAMANGLWASAEWSASIGRQSIVTGKDVVPLIRSLARLAVRFAWPIPVCMLLADALAFYVVRTAPVAMATPAPAWMNNWHDVLLGGMSHDVGLVTQWKMSAWGQGLGIFFDSATQALGGFFCMVGMSLGLIVIRYGVKIEPRKN